MKIVKENMAKHDKKGALTSGRGTMMMVKEGMVTQMARKAFNTEKTIVHIAKLKEKTDHNVIIGAH